MEINEKNIKVGNLVYRINQVTKEKNMRYISPIDIMDISTNGDKYFIFKPIQLTEEVLLKCGAVKSSKFFLNEFEDYVEFWINEFFSVVFIYSRYSGVNDFEIFYKSHGEKVHGIKNTEYLHTLQNFLALTGEELTYNH